MVYCAYCGKSFTRKEHLERHLPSHTNVKPHLCPHCSLGFSRRDLLSRHLSTYHIEKDDMQRTPGSANTLNGRTQIACRSCAQAKTGCDKRLPKCTRCLDKSLPCELRYARRAPKAAARAGIAAAHHKQLEASMLAPLPEAKQDGTTAIHEIRSIGVQATQSDIRLGVTMSPDEAPITIDPRISQHDGLPMKSPSTNLHSGLEDICTQEALMGGIQDALPYNAAFLSQDMSIWEWEYSNLATNMQTPQDHVQSLTYMLSPPEELISPTLSADTRRNSIMSPNMLEVAVGEMEPDKQPNIQLDIPPDGQSPALRAMIAAEPAWPLARCNSLVYSGDCPRTAFLHLNHLRLNLNHESAYSSLAGLSMAKWDNNDLASVTPIRSETRDQILAIAQSFLHKALEIHNNSHVYNGGQQNGNPGLLGVLVLPSSGNLDYFLRNYVRSLGFYYSLVSNSRLDPNDIIKRNQTATLLVLFMIAQGASGVPIEEARALSTGLIETCRISLFDTVEKNVDMCADSTVHRCALIFTLLGAWSGDKWLMDIAMGQRGMYLAMLQHAGMFKKPPESPMALLPNSTAIGEDSWRSWLDREMMNRLVYNWVMVDQELSLFHDVAPLLSLDELRAPLPGPEEWWTSPNGDYWIIAMSTIHNPSSLTPSLYDLFQDFLHDRLSADQPAGLTPYRMRLLLHPIHSYLWQSRMMKLHFSDTSMNETRIPILSRKENTLLERWRDICYIHCNRDPDCLVTRTNLILSHLISLNDAVHFLAIEQYARCEPGIGQLILFPLDAVYHCGQVLRIVRAMPADQRPVWWSVAVYRVMLILWTLSNLRSNAISEDQNASLDENAATGSPVVIDHSALLNERIFSCLWKENSVPVLSGPDGSTLSLAEPADVLTHAMEILSEGVSTRFGDGIKHKLVELHATWYSTPPIN